jgi:hypothetical protein
MIFLLQWCRTFQISKQGVIAITLEIWKVRHQRSQALARRRLWQF